MLSTHSWCSCKADYFLKELALGEYTMPVVGMLSVFDWSEARLLIPQNSNSSNDHFGASRWYLGGPGFTPSTMGGPWMVRGEEGTGKVAKKIRDFSHTKHVSVPFFSTKNRWVWFLRCRLLRTRLWSPSWRWVWRLLEELGVQGVGTSVKVIELARQESRP